MLGKNTKKITVRFPKRLKAEMLQSLVNSGYGLRGKSKWLAEAAQLFLQQTNMAELAEHGVDINQPDLTEIEAFYLSLDTLEKIRKASISIRQQSPLFVGVQSAVIRSAVIYRLMLGK